MKPSGCHEPEDTSGHATMNHEDMGLPTQLRDLVTIKSIYKNKKRQKGARASCSVKQLI